MYLFISVSYTHLKMIAAALKVSVHQVDNTLSLLDGGATPGGYMATAINDFIQGIIMLFGICAVILALSLIHI